jgi:hypothetical protein
MDGGAAHPELGRDRGLAHALDVVETVDLGPVVHAIHPYLLALDTRSAQGSTVPNTPWGMFRFRPSSGAQDRAAVDRLADKGRLGEDERSNLGGRLRRRQGAREREVRKAASRSAFRRGVVRGWRVDLPPSSVPSVIGADAMSAGQTPARPPIGAEMEKEVRRRCGFGCVMCGLPLYEYDHILGWSNVQRHVAEEITLLCEMHHREKTNGLLPLDHVVAANREPFNLRRAVSRPHDLHSAALAANPLSDPIGS